MLLHLLIIWEYEISNLHNTDNLLVFIKARIIPQMLDNNSFLKSLPNLFHQSFFDLTL